MTKVSWGYSPSSEVLAANTLHFKPILNSFETICKGDRRPRWRCASKTWSFSSTCKNFGAKHPRGQNMVFQKALWVNTIWPLDLCDYWTKVYLTFFATQKEPRPIVHLPDFEYLCPFRRYSPPKFEVVRNRAKFCMFLAPEIFERYYKIWLRPTTDHRAKFYADWKTHLGDLALK